MPVFDGHRVILLGPPAYTRFWGSQRQFANLQARFEIEQRLTKPEVHDWLDRMAAAK